MLAEHRLFAGGGGGRACEWAHAHVCLRCHPHPPARPARPSHLGAAKPVGRIPSWGGLVVMVVVRVWGLWVGPWHHRIHPSICMSV